MANSHHNPRRNNNVIASTIAQARARLSPSALLELATLRADEPEWKAVLDEMCPAELPMLCPHGVAHHQLCVPCELGETAPRPTRAPRKPSIAWSPMGFRAAWAAVLSQPSKVGSWRFSAAGAYDPALDVRVDEVAFEEAIDYALTESNVEELQLLKYMALRLADPVRGAILIGAIDRPYSRRK